MITNYIEAKSLKLVALGDTHIGNANTDYDALKNAISFVKKEKAMLIGLGDWADGITATDKRFDLGTIDPNFVGDDFIADQYAYIYKLFKPISKQIVGLHCGNHDTKLRKLSHTDHTKRLCSDLGVPYLNWMAYTRLHYKRPGRQTSFDIYSTHGSSTGGSMTGGKVNVMEKMSNAHVADLYLMGHTHECVVTSKAYDFLDQNLNIAERYRFYGNTGTFLKGIVQNKSSYAEEANYPPNKVSYLVFEFNPETHMIQGREVIC